MPDNKRQKVPFPKAGDEMVRVRLGSEEPEVVVLLEVVLVAGGGVVLEGSCNSLFLASCRPIM